MLLFAILQKYDFSSKSQRKALADYAVCSCLRYCKSTIFQANHNTIPWALQPHQVVCDTAKVRFFKQITTQTLEKVKGFSCLRYCKSTIFQANHNQGFIENVKRGVVCDTAKVRFFKQITTSVFKSFISHMLFAILQKYDFSSKSQHVRRLVRGYHVVCDTAKVRFFKQITTTLN